MDDHRSYYEEEEPSPKPRSRWLGGLILGLILGGIIGFVIGSGNPGGFFDDMQSGFASEGVWIVFTLILIIGVAMLKSMFIRRNNGGNAQAARLLVMVFLIAMALAFGVLFFAGL
jgi:predicted lipid-binding transport protein (Tim44 family)